ncbi:CBO0543 family protein [Virgibacillus sp. DJP39]|uniref:CBO0543 family protein n=1 Tax=Virgibacillus sp. DJP39 TaxID=3409790 RepID=UPI003BB7A936
MAFLIISIFAFTLAVKVAKKRLPLNELYAVSLFSILLGFVTDITFDLKYNFYGYFEPGVQFAGFLPILFIFSTAGALYVNYFPYERSFFIKSSYIFIATIFCLLYEWLSIKSGYFYHNEWTFWYSTLVYPLLFWLHILHLKFYRKYFK